MHTPEQEELIKLRRLVEQQKKMLETKDAEIEKQRIQIENLTQAILHARKKMYDPSSEVTAFPGQMSLFPEQEQLLRELEGRQKDITVPAHTRKVRKAGVREDMLSSLETEVERCIVGQDETCPVCGADLVKVGEKVIRTEVVYEPAKLKVKQYVQEVKKCTRCGTEDSAKPTPTFVGAHTPKPVLPHSIASPSLVAGILYQKYDMGIPLARQERDWYRIGLALHRSTMSGWVIRTGSYEPVRAVLFHYSRSRSGAEARKLYAGFHGYLVTDACSSYEQVEGITRSLCWSHLRRYYIESIPLDSSGKELKGSKGAEAREQCDKLFRIEKQIRDLGPQERLEKRKELSQPVLEAFWSWVDETSKKYTTNESLKKALQYSLNQKRYLNTFMEDGRLPISNNECEACIRPFANGRKAWLFADTPKGAWASGIVYSLVESAKLNHLDVFQYLAYLLKKMPGIDYQYLKEPEVLDEYLPWSESLPENCRLPKKK